jgi:ABC-type antimicrobial peptide transport system permease subunit
MILRQGITVVIAGLGIGIAASFALAPLVSNHLFEVSATDLSILAGASLLLAATGLTACYLPIRSATETDAAIVLRSE